MEAYKYPACPLIPNKLIYAVIWEKTKQNKTRIYDTFHWNTIEQLFSVFEPSFSRVKREPLCCSSLCHGYIKKNFHVYSMHSHTATGS